MNATRSEAREPARTIVLAMPGAPAPREALERLAGSRFRVLLESAEGRGRYSFLSADPVLVLRADERGARVRGEGLPGGPRSFPDAFRALGAILGRTGTPPPPPSIPFAGGLVGFIGYEAGDALERLPPPPAADLHVPRAWFGLYPVGILWDHGSGACRGVATVLPEASVPRTRKALEDLIGAVLSPRDPSGSSAPSPASRDRGRPPERPSGRGLRTSLDREAFEDGVERIREHIRAGALFQANLTRMLSVPAPGDGVALYRRLVERSPAPYAAYLEVEGARVASVSPELFLTLRGARVTTRPIKGTAPRGKGEVEDRRLRDGLAASEKDRAENVMIVDLLRNDLSRVCRDGSVRVARLLDVETHPTVHHLVSTVNGTLRGGVGPADLLAATFPGGSVTGAPKIRAMEILRGLEPVRRGVYTGALGILGFHGDLDLSVAIRTAVLQAGWAHYGTGGGITLASDPEAEWWETEDKARAFLEAMGDPSPGPGASRGNRS